MHGASRACLGSGRTFSEDGGRWSGEDEVTSSLLSSLDTRQLIFHTLLQPSPPSLSHHLDMCLTAIFSERSTVVVSTLLLLQISL